MEDLGERNEGRMYEWENVYACVRNEWKRKKNWNECEIERKLMFPIKQREEKRKRKRKNTDNTVEMFT